MDEDVTTIHITKALSSAIIVDLMEKYPNLETITCSPSVYNRTSDTYIDALSQLDIEVVKKYNWGAESKTNGEEFKVLELSNEGLKPKEIAEKLKISEKTIRNHISNTMQKLGVNGRAAAVVELLKLNELSL